ncbi:MAG TPA: hypothetical protein VK745_13420, partial [Polyangiaceae bacterium]|nr:hypothetical protein [Polyangiaceae bacterium]
ASLVIRGPISFDESGDSVELNAKSEATVRALGEVLNQHPNLIVLVGAKPTASTPEAEQRALSESFAIVSALRRFTHRDEVAETVSFQAVATTPGAGARRIGFGLLE